MTEHLDKVHQGADNTRRALIKKIDVGVGENIGYVTQEAAKMVLNEGLDAVEFEFNEKGQRITNEEARAMYSPDNLRREIHSYEKSIESSLDNIRFLRKQIKRDQQLGMKVYGEGFTQPKPSK